MNRNSLQNVSLAVSLAVILVLTAVAVKLYLKPQKAGFAPLTSLRFFSLLLALTTIGHSYAWQHHFVTLIPGFIAESVYLMKKKNTLRGFLLLASAILVGYHFPDISHPPTTNPILISHTLVGALVLIGLLVMF